MTQRRKIQMKISTCDKSDSSLSKYVSTKVNMSLILNNHSGSKQVATRVWSFEGRQRAGLREGVEEIRDQDRWQRQTANDGHRREDQTNVPRGARNFIPRLPQVEDGIGDTLLAASSSIPTLVSDWVTDDYQFERSTRQCLSSQITCNFLTQASWRLYEIRQPPTSLLLLCHKMVW